MKFYQKIQLLIVNIIIEIFNFILSVLNKILFKKFNFQPRNILIYKIGNIGDIVCAVPSFIAIRKNFPDSKITLLTSPGGREMVGAKELLNGTWYLDEMKVYYSDNIDSWRKKKEFIKNLRENNYNLFIQLPDDLANFRTLFRNMIFARLLGIKSAFGFKIRTIQAFKKTQVDYSFKKNEVENLLDILSENGIRYEKIEFGFNIDEGIENRIASLLRGNFGFDYEKELIIAMSPAGKREANKWPVERYQKLTSYLIERYNAKIVIVGGNSELEYAKIIKNGFSDKDVLILAGKLNLLETIEFFKKCLFLISNDTGTAHMAASVNLPIVGIYGVRNVFGSWFPYGKKHKIIYHKFINCDYRDENCIKKSTILVSLKEMVSACNQIIEELKNY